MKKITQILVIAILSLGFSTAKASDKKVFDDVNENYYPPVDYRNADPIVFLERGIEFYVFPNGDFDFNTVETTAPRSSSGRENRNTTYGAPGVRTRSYNHYSPRNYGTKIEHDYYGRVRRIGNVFINYDFDGRVKRVGSVYMRYNSFALTQIGGMRIVYDRHGCIVNSIGYVNASSHSHGYSHQNNHYQADNYYNNNNNDADNDEDYYYYRKDGSKSKMSKDDIKELKEKN